MTFLINYDLFSPGRNYSALINSIQSYDSWARIGRSCWAVKSECTAIQILYNLAQYIDENDLLFVCEIRSWSSANLRQEIITWLNT